MKKIIFLLMPIVAIGLLANCGGGSKSETTHSVYLDPNGGKIKNNVDVIKNIADGSLIAKPELLDREGYNKEEVVWYKTNDFKESSKFNFETDKVRSDLFLHAKWGEIQKCIVSFYEGDADTPVTKEVDYGGKPVYYTPNTPSGHTGDVFLGWYVSRDEGARSFDFNQQIKTNDVKAYARWSGTSTGHQVIWAKADGTILEIDKNVTPGTLPTYNGDNPTQETDNDHVSIFAGWSPSITEVTDSDQLYIARFGEVCTKGGASFTVDIPKGGATITLTFGPGAAEGIEVDWGDGDSPSTNFQHTYSGVGLYEIVLTGFCETIKFDDCGANSLIALYLGSSVDHLDPEASFGWNEKLKWVFIGDNDIALIDGSSFVGCFSLEAIKVSDKNPRYTSRSLDGTECNAIITKASPRTLLVSSSNTVIPDGVTSIDYDAFGGRSGISSIYIPSSVNDIEHGAFVSCPNLNKIKVDDKNSTYTSKDSNRNECNVIVGKSNHVLIVGSNNTVIPDGVTSIASYAFAGSGIASVNIPSSVTNIEDTAFENCFAIENIEIDENNTTYTSQCNGVECDAIISRNGNTLLLGCKNTLLLNPVKTIYVRAFKGCVGLTSIKIPSGIEEIYNEAFAGCYNLITVDLTDFSSSPLPSLIDEEYGKAFEDNNGDLKFYVASGMAAVFKVAEGWKDYNPDHFTESPVPIIY